MLAGWCGARTLRASATKALISSAVFLASGCGGLHVQRGHAQTLRVRLAQMVAEPRAAQDEHKAVLFDRLDKDLDARQLDLAQLGRRA